VRDADVQVRASLVWVESKHGLCGADVILLAELTGLPVCWQKSRYNALPGGTTALTKAQVDGTKACTNNHLIKLERLLYAIYCSLKLSECKKIPASFSTLVGG
jgi:hypothetical protein